MSDKYRQPEQRRVESNPEQRYGKSGQQTGAQTSPQSSRSGGQQFQQTGGQMGRTGGQIGQTGGGTGQQFGGGSTQMGRQGSQMSQQSPQMGGQQTPIRPVTVRDIAATNVVTTRPDAPVTEAVQKMATKNVGAVVVVQQNRPVGIVTDRKITLTLSETPDVSRMQVSDLMTEDAFTVSENTNVFDLIRQLSDWGVRRAPVVDEQENLRGIVSLDDAIVLLAEEFHNVGQIIRKQSPRL